MYCDGNHIIMSGTYSLASHILMYVANLSTALCKNKAECDT